MEINGDSRHWAIFALLSAFFAGMTAILAKIGIQGVESNLATVIRTVVVLIFAAAIVLARGEASGVRNLSSRTWVFLILSGLATGASWLCYYRALSLGPVSQVAPIDKLSFVISVLGGILLFQEKLTWQLGVGVTLIVLGVLMTLWSPEKKSPEKKLSPAKSAVSISSSERYSERHTLPRQ